jgi:hypothetical protein
MSPIPRTVLRSAGRALPRLQQTTLGQPQQQKQAFSIMYSLRTFARSFEPHPFQRLPIASKPAPADWGRIVRRVAGQAVMYVGLLFSLFFFFSPILPSCYILVSLPVSSLPYEQTKTDGNTVVYVDQ